MENGVQMDDMELWGDLLEKSNRKLLTDKDGEYQVLDMENHFGRHVIGKILVLPRIDAQRFTYDKPWACISISDSSCDEASIRDGNRVDILKLEFDDIQRIKSGYKRINFDQAKSIIEFTDKLWDEIDLLLIHCNAGISRSPACALVISERHQPEHAQLFEKLYSPNDFVVRMLRKVISSS